MELRLSPSFPLPPASALAPPSELLPLTESQQLLFPLSEMTGLATLTKRGAVRSRRLRRVKGRVRRSRRAIPPLYGVLEQANCLVWHADVREVPAESEEQVLLDPVRHTRLHWDIHVVNQGAATVPSWLPVAREQGESVTTAWVRSRHPDDERQAAVTASEALHAGKSRYTQTFRNRMADGTTRWMFEDVRVEARFSSSKSGAGSDNPIGLPPLRRWRLTGVVTDITDKMLAEERLRAMAGQLRQITEQANCLLWQAEVAEIYPIPSYGAVFDPIRDTGLSWRNMEIINEAEVLSWLPIDRQENEPFQAALDRARQPEDFDLCNRRCFEALRSAAARYTQSFRVIVQDGSVRWLQEDVRVESRQGSEERCPTGDPLRTWRLTGVVTDVTERKRTEEALWWRANHDRLTGLPNRHWIQDRIQGDLLDLLPQLSGKGHGCLFVLDLDGFKYVNDSLGHETGDRFLQAAAAQLERIVHLEAERLGERIALARLGGDEFVIWIPRLGTLRADLCAEPDACVRAAAEVAERLLQAISQPVRLDSSAMGKREVLVTGSVGIALFPDDGMDTETLLKNADTALYQAKEAGRGKYRFHTAERSIAIANHLAMETRLRRAVADEALTLRYQPQIDVITRQVVGVEALLRWKDDELGAVPPSTFIPLAEEIGIIHALGEFALRSACRQIAIWRRERCPALRICVNLSALQLVEAGMSGIVLSALEETGLPGDALELEITETALFRSGEQGVANFLREVRAAGVRLAIDDFGTGYSSLAYLRSVRVDVVKIDQGFICEITQNPQTRAIVRAIIDLSHALGLTVTAEGVETEAQQATLAALDCDTLQGYLFSRPLIGPDMEELLAAPPWHLEMK